jgi:hypothetical protein
MERPVLPAELASHVERLLADLMATRQRPTDLDAARRRHAALVAAHEALEAAGEWFGARILAALAGDAQQRAHELAAAEAEAEAERERSLEQTTAKLAAEYDGPACSLDGGPSNPLLGVAEWLDAIEAWAQER